jgi:hypothetical protein
MTRIELVVAVGTKSLLRSEMYKASTTLLIKELFRTPQQSSHGKPQLRENVPMGGTNETALWEREARPKWWFSSHGEYRNRGSWKVTEGLSFGKDTGDIPHFETQA